MAGLKGVFICGLLESTVTIRSIAILAAAVAWLSPAAGPVLA